jgi:rubrerythrin
MQKESWTGPFKESLKGENVNQNKRDTLDDMLIALSEVSAEEVSAERAQLSKEGINFSKLDDGIKSIMTQPKAQKHAWLYAGGVKVTIWSCNDCGMTFLVRVGRVPSACPICGSTRVVRGE